MHAWKREFRAGEWAVAAPVFGSGGTVVAALELTVPNLRTDLAMASSVLTVATRGLSRELAAGRRVGCLSLVAEQQMAAKLRRNETDRRLMPALIAGALPVTSHERYPRCFRDSDHDDQYEGHGDARRYPESLHPGR
jgi:hypothetical protein